MVPKVGQIVYYISGVWSDRVKLAAIITRANIDEHDEGACSLCVFEEAGFRFLPYVMQGDDAGEWEFIEPSYPEPRVRGYSFGSALSPECPQCGELTYTSYVDEAKKESGNECRLCDPPYRWPNEWITKKMREEASE